MSRRIAMLVLNVLAAAVAIDAQTKPSCRGCSATYIAADEIQAYFQRSPGAMRNSVADQQVRAVDVGRSNVAIGVVYRAKRERWGNYVPTIIPRRYDAFIFCDETQALAPLHLPVKVGEVPDTFPYGQ